MNDDTIIVPTANIGTPHNPPTCIRCSEPVAPMFVDGTRDDGDSWSDLWIPDLCPECAHERSLRRADRIYQAWKLSGLSPKDAEELTSIEDWRFWDWDQDKTRITGHHDAFLLDDECGRVVRLLLQEARRQGRSRPRAKVVPFVSKASGGAA